MNVNNDYFERGTALYPQPIALSCGRICRARNLQERLDAILKCAETVTRYLAAVAISSFAAREEETVEVPKSFNQFVGNLSFGHFLAVVQEISNGKYDHPARTLLQGKKRKKAYQQLSELLTLRNQLGHDLMSMSEAKARLIFTEQQPETKLETALRALEMGLTLPLFLVEEQKFDSEGRLMGLQLLLMSDSADPLPKMIQLDRNLKRSKGLYVGLWKGVLCLHPFLLWDMAKARANYSLYLIHAIDVENNKVKYITVQTDQQTSNSRLVQLLRQLGTGETRAVEEVTFQNGQSFLKEWQRQKEHIEKVWREQSGAIPWDAFDDKTVRWYAHHLGAENKPNVIRQVIIDRLLDGRIRLQPEEIQQMQWLLGKEKVVRQLIQRAMIDCRARKNPDTRWDERVESYGNLLVALREAIGFFGRHVGIDGVTLDGMEATSGSADYIAMREALVNLFIHQDYTDSTTVAQIEITSDQAIFFNAGKSLVSRRALVEGGKSQSRNPLISRALRLIGFAELAGSGLRLLRNAWNKEKRRPPKAESDDAANTFTLTLDWRPLPPPDPFWRRRLGIELNTNEAAALNLSFEPNGTSREDIASIQNILLEEAETIVERLLREQLVKEQDNRIYIQQRVRDNLQLAKFYTYLQYKGSQLTEFDLDAVRLGFKEAWRNKKFDVIINVAEKLPKKVLQEDKMLLRWYDNAVTRSKGGF